MARPDPVNQRQVRIFRGGGRHGEVQFKHRFEIELPNDFSSADAARKVEQRIINISPAMEVVMPAENAPTKNSHWYYMGDDDSSPFTMEFIETTDQATVSFFWDWRSAQINNDGTYNIPKVYKRSIKIYLLSPQDERLRTITLVDCFPNQLTIPDLSYNENTPMTLSVGFTYDGPETAATNNSQSASQGLDSSIREEATLIAANGSNRVSVA